MGTVKLTSRRSGIDLRKQVARFGVDSLMPDWKPPKGVRQLQKEKRRKKGKIK